MDTVSGVRGLEHHAGGIRRGPDSVSLTQLPFELSHVSQPYPFAL